MAYDNFTQNNNVRSIVWDAILEPLAYDDMMSLGTATALTIPTGAIAAIVQPQNQAVRIRMDGVNPTAAVGLTMNAGQWYFLNSDLTQIRVIEAVAGAVLAVQYFGRGEND